MKCKQTSTVGCYITSKQIQPRGGPFAWRSGEVFCLVVQAFALMSIFALDFFFLNSGEYIFCFYSLFQELQTLGK